MSLLACNVTPEALAIELIPWIFVVLLIPIDAPLFRLGGEDIFPRELACDEFKVMDEILLHLEEVWWELALGVGDEVALVLRVDENAAGHKAAPDHVLGEVPPDPRWGGAGEQVDPGVGDFILSHCFRFLLEGADLPVPEGNEGVNHLAILRVEECAELGGGYGDGTHGVVLLVDDELLGGAREGGDESLPGHRVRAEVDAGNLAQEIHPDRGGSGFGYNAGRGDENNIAIWGPLEITLVNPDAAPKCPGDGADRGPEVEHVRSFGVGGIF